MDSSGEEEMRPSTGLWQSCLSFLLKFLNYLQAFLGISVLLYSIWMLSHWHGSNLGKHSAPWFIYTMMGAGGLLCFIAVMGRIAAEASNGCCLCFYAVFTSVLILVEAALVADLIFNKHWEEDLPYDATGELRSLRAFIEANIDIFKSFAISVVVVQAFSLLLAMILRAWVPPRRLAYESDEDFTDMNKPLLNPQVGSASVSTSVSTSVNSTEIHPDTWNTRMREKYGLVRGPLSSSAADPKASVSSSSNDERKQCSIM